MVLLSNRYRKIRNLAAGGFGETFLAEDTQMPSNRHCVVKQLKPITDDPKVYDLVKERFHREAAILETLGEGSDQVPTLYAYFEENSQFYLVQEWIDGKTLNHVLGTQGLLDEEAVKTILLGLLPAFDYIHQHRIIHRDVKPSNIILRQSTQKPVLIDFGAVKESMGTVVTTSGHTSRSIVIGTPGFMAPEQAVGRPVYASDLYGVGMTAIYLLSGKIANEFESDLRTGELLWWPHVPRVSPAFAAILNQAIQPHARDRFSSASSMITALQAGTRILAVALPTNFIGALPQKVPQAASPIGQQPLEQPQPTQRQEQQTQPQPVPDQDADSLPLNPGIGARPSPIPVFSSVGASQSTPISASDGMGRWRKTVGLTSVIGGFLLLGIFITGRSSTLAYRAQTQNSDRQVVRTEKTSSSRDGTIQSSGAEKTSSRQTEPGIASRSSESRPVVIPRPVITTSKLPTREVGEYTVAIARWLQAKQLMFGQSYDRGKIAELTTGKLSQEVDTFINSLKSKNVYHEYRSQEIQDLKVVADEGSCVSVEATVIEDIAIHTADGQLDGDNSGKIQSVVRYELELMDGRWKIASDNQFN